MFDQTSRYFAIETATLTTKDREGEPYTIRYKRRRFIPSAENMTTIVEHTVTQGDRLDNITARYLGDPTQFWRVCDANEVMKPEDLEEIGMVIKIAMPGL